MTQTLDLRGARVNLAVNPGDDEAFGVPLWADSAAEVPPAAYGTAWLLEVSPGLTVRVEPHPTDDTRALAVLTLPAGFTETITRYRRPFWLAYVAAGHRVTLLSGEVRR